tara:strand:+ start:87 stop:440 length:354 start_codon:yes stop_codon:yes gene_type:complete
MKSTTEEIKREKQRLGVSQTSKGHKIIKTISKRVVGQRKRKGCDGKLYDTYKTVIIGKYRKPSEKTTVDSGNAYSYGHTCFQGCDHEYIFENQPHDGKCFCTCHNENELGAVEHIFG